VVRNSNGLLFADDFKMFREMNPPVEKPAARFWSQTVWIVCHLHRGNRRSGTDYWLRTAIFT